ncbi:MAG: hypothetical protein F6J93_00800 [Oscillatoria sp. SIO1A7]|nr:hypothetical protein [Oscillatoria sp. SIO1A7]
MTKLVTVLGVRSCLETCKPAANQRQTSGKPALDKEQKIAASGCISVQVLLYIPCPSPCPHVPMSPCPPVSQSPSPPTTLVS